MKIKKEIIVFVSLIGPVMMSCSVDKKEKVRLVTLDPGHFHAALVQKTMYPEVDSLVYVYSPGGNDLQQHLERIDAFNARKDNPTHWKEEVFAGNDFFEKMIFEKKGNVVVLSGNNQKKSEYILKSLQHGFHVLADKPMAITPSGFEQLKQAFSEALKNDLMLYDIMTERFEINSILQREFALIPEIFGTLQQGTPDNPAVIKESTHYFFKNVSGKVLTRPAWFFDTAQEGEGIADVMTHLVDLVQWECFPEQAIDYTKEIEVNAAKHWTTDLGIDQFKTVTHLDSFPSYLKNYVTHDSLKVFCNGEIHYTIRGVHVKTTAKWGYKAPEGSGDTYYASMRGTKANLVIRQGEEEQYHPVLYIEPVERDSGFDLSLRENMKIIQARYPGVDIKSSKAGWQVFVPEKYKEGHEAHFARVTEHFLEYLKNKNIPAWEVPGMLAKYYTTTRAIEMINTSSHHNTTTP
jgi:predicted dehydrogenase